VKLSNSLISKMDSDLNNTDGDVQEQTPKYISDIVNERYSEIKLRLDKNNSLIRDIENHISLILVDSPPSTNDVGDGFFVDHLENSSKKKLIEYLDDINELIERNNTNLKSLIKRLQQ
jgi:hypothetical protein